MPKKKSHTQELIESIMIQYKLTDVGEAWRIYRRKYEVDKELDPKVVNDLAVD